ncbi:uncharacterized protein FOMMEDRAFT_20762 [Fomitiporia mediterranea MF3/22]|uniref:uncharacterized protein n=1 Tax=Fomitiporia mediterranea (strain MF3/22) TaxID=694068 RepID=UPI0004407AA8|nr:uncharacterized protein FOMMEDRAFT_20762 [Fomitiporia mediterranea MF3/22]EJD01979.1 hypothetical protein FOMMEDRAFT_20762 [Fomitiporia mediterranea MF3/22]
MIPIEESNEKPRRRRQSSVPPPSYRQHRQQDGDGGSDIGSPPSVPLPPLPPTAKSDASFGESTPKPTQTQTPGTASSVHSRGPPSVKSLPSLRSRRSSKSASTYEHGRQESGVSVTSCGSGISSFSSVAPSFSEFGVATRHRITSEGEQASELRKSSTEDGLKGRTRTPRSGAFPLRIDIPPSFAQEKERLQRQQQQHQIERALGSARSAGSGNSLTSPLPREVGERFLRDRTTEGEKMNSPTASLFSIASVVTTRSGMSAAQCLRTRVSGMLDGLGNMPLNTTQSTSPSSNAPVSRTSPSPNLGGEEQEGIQHTQNSGLHPPNMSVPSANGAGPGDNHAMLTAEDLLAELTALSGAPLGDGDGAFSPPELSTKGKTFRAMRADVTSQVTSPSLVHISLSGVETGGNDNDMVGAGSKLSPSLLGQFPTTPTTRTRPPPSSFPFPSTSSQSSKRTPMSASSSSSNGITRTMSQSRRKPLPPDPRGVRSSVSSLGSDESAKSRYSASIADGAMDAVRGRTNGGRGSDRDGATSPDIAAMMCATPRPVLRSKSLSARSSRSSKSLSARSSSARSSVRTSARPSLPDERERLKALARVSAVSSSSSTPPPRVPSITRKDMSGRRSGGSEYSEAYGGIEEDGDATVDYGVAIARHRGAYDLSPSLLQVDERLENEMDEFGVLRNGTDATDFYAEEAEAMLGTEYNGSPDAAEEESDSDIDLHTPLPHILLREGVLSPHSKLLTSTSMSSLSARSSFVDSGRDSVASYATHASLGSVMTKSGLFKDERNTEGRRRRHRDGKLLREGLGLTTGLGWSDSEDEDAPSPFTDRLSKLALSRKTSMASVQSSSSKKSQVFARSIPSSLKTRTPSTNLTPPSLASSLSRSPVMSSERQLLSKSNSSLNSMGVVAESVGKRTSPTPTNSSAASVPFPSTPREDIYDESEGSLLSGSISRSRTTSRTPSSRVKTLTVKSVRTAQSTSQLRPQATATLKSIPPSRLPSTGMSTPRPLRLPALQQQRVSYVDTEEDGMMLQPGQPTPGSGSILGYNRNLHDRQRAALLATPATAPSKVNPSSLPSPPSPVLSAKSAPSTATTFESRRTFGSMLATSTLRPPTRTVSREPSPSRLSAPSTSLGRPRTGTGMVYRQSSLPVSPVGTAI